MKTGQTKQKVTISLDSSVYQQLKQITGSRGVGEYVSNVLKGHLPVVDIAQSYRAMAAYEREHADSERDEWMNAPIDAPLPPDDFSTWQS